MKLRISLLVALTACGQAFATPQGSWPEAMRGYTLPRQDWIMIIPATRMPDGSVSVWNRSDGWNREWTVPRATPSGTRTVAVNGDSEDMRIVSPAQIDNMSVSSLSKLAGKYGASAIAVVVAEETGGVAVAAWAKGNFATWDTTSGDGENRRSTALAALDGIYSGGGSAPPSIARDQMPSEVSILGQRYDEVHGRMEYRLTSSEAVLERIASDGAFAVTSRNENVPPSLDLVVVDGRDIEKALADAGLTLR